MKIYNFRARDDMLDAVKRAGGRPGPLVRETLRSVEAVDLAAVSSATLATTQGVTRVGLRLEEHDLERVAQLAEALRVSQQEIGSRAFDIVAAGSLNAHRINLVERLAMKAARRARGAGERLVISAHEETSLMLEVEHARRLPTVSMFEVEAALVERDTRGGVYHRYASSPAVGATLLDALEISIAAQFERVRKGEGTRFATFARSEQPWCG